MNPTGKILLDLFYLVVGITAISLNIFLIFIAHNLSSHKRSVRFAIILAAFDILLPASAILTLIHNLVRGSNISEIPHACQIKGPIDFFGISFSMMLVSIIAVERLHVMLGQEISRIVWAFYGCFVASYLGLIIVAAIQQEFYMLPNGIDCTPLPSASIVSAAVSGMFALSLFAFLFLTFGSYMAILRNLSRRSIYNTEFANTKTDYSTQIDKGGNLKQSIPKAKKQNSVSFRIAVITISYFIIVFPSCIMIVVNALIDREDQQLVDTIQMIGDIFLSLIALANPCLVLFAHSKMYQSFTSSFLKFYKAFRR